MTRHVHFVGSIGLDTAQDVFTSVGSLLGEHLVRIPDGEPGGRRMWTNWQFPHLRGMYFLQPDWDQKPTITGCLPLRLIDGAKPEDIHFGELGYAREARASYQDFLAARAAGKFPKSVRFQVALPTPFAILASGVRQQDIPAVEPAYKDAMLREVKAICDAIPHNDLSLQWDVCIEMLAWDGRSFIPRFPGIENVFGAKFRKLCAVVPADVQLGFHLCYGDLDAKHTIEPEDTAKLLDMGHFLIASTEHPVAYIHMPVPIGRHDDAFFAPLKGMKFPAGTELFLGLVHAQDGGDGAKRRMAAAGKFVETFGVASECGISRRSPAVVRQFLDTYAQAAKA